jgi:DNA polymerase III subunit gamma/tau
VPGCGWRSIRPNTAISLLLMAYQVLARKWRPSNFSQLVGQEHVSQSLIHALQHHRLHHAYLFTGTRGVGKTTLARILAKAMNCQNLNNSNPCGECSVCLDFENGRFMDLIEVDAASRTKVEDTRDLLENTQYAPNQGSYKIYLIDEVHMLSGHSFNALLKTLEEPPPHVKFLLATTDPQKIPITVLSRCLQFNLKRLTINQIVGQLQYILQQEEIGYEPESLIMLARAADGSMRDALSLLDQAIVYGGGEVADASVTGMLGTISQQPVNDILRLLTSRKAQEVMQTIADISIFSPNYAEILQQMLRILHRVAVFQQVANYVDQEFDAQFIEMLAENLSPEDVQLFYQIALVGQRDLELAPDPRSGFEMLILRMLAFRIQVLPDPSETESKPKEAQISSEKKTIPEIVESKNWSEVIAELNLNGLSKDLINNCVLDGIDEHNCRLSLDSSYQKISAKAEEKLREALQNYYGRPLNLIIKQQAITQMTPALEMQRDRENKQQMAIDSINSDKNVQTLKERFSARILPGSIEPLN